LEQIQINRKSFIALSGIIAVIAVRRYYLSIDKSNFVRKDFKQDVLGKIPFSPHEKEILLLASRA
jgi:hypothetical protein